MKKLLIVLVCLTALVMTSCGNIGGFGFSFEDEEIAPETAHMQIEGDLKINFKYNGETVKEDTEFFAEGIREPGEVSVESFSVTNTGLIAFNYRLMFECDSPLAEYLYVAVVDDTNEENMVHEEIVKLFDENNYSEQIMYFAQEGTLLPGEDSEYTFAVYLKPEAADAVTAEQIADCKIKATLVATQIVAEEDSFGNAYAE